MNTADNDFAVASGLREGGFSAGNRYDEHGSRKTLVRLIVQGFERAFAELVARTGARSIHEVGCGEGLLTIEWAASGIDARGSDFSAQAVALARANCERRGAKARFRVASVYDLEPSTDAAELVVCCEVLEHLDEPEEALRVLARIASPWLLISVPREPLWSALNLARGKHWSSWGNTPGHVQHWGARGFVDLLARRFEVVDVRRPLPWTMVLCRAPLR